MMVTWLIKLSVVLGIINLLQAPLYFSGIQEIQEKLDIVVVLAPTDRVQVNNIFKKPILSFGRNDFSQTIVRTVNKDFFKLSNF
jgi:hypothetical protein